MFGLVLGLLCSFVGWRLRAKGHPAGAASLWASAIILTAFAWSAPAYIEPLERRWLSVARVLGKINTFVVLAVVYYLILTPFALVMRLASGDPLERGWGPGSYWKKRTSGEDLESYHRQF